jgi:hypothetical protein
MRTLLSEYGKIPHGRRVSLDRFAFETKQQVRVMSGVTV